MQPSRKKKRTWRLPIVFEIEYFTQWGQNVYVTGNQLQLGRWDIDRAKRMEYQKDGIWRLSLLLENPSKELTYRYFLKDDRGGAPLFEFGERRKVRLEDYRRKRPVLKDSWRARQEEGNVFYASAFTSNIMRPKRRRRRAAVKRYSHVFRLSEPLVDPDHLFCLLGSDPQLGGWNPENAVLMEANPYPVWEARVSIDPSVRSIEYKYGIYDAKRKKFVAFESGENRLVRLNGSSSANRVDVHTDNRFGYSADSWKGAGTAIPVFSLRSKKSGGVGEYADIKILIDWAEKVGLKLVQLLPINDTTASHRWFDSYPYAAISVFALHPIYLRMEDMGELRDKRKMKRYLAEAERLNEKPEIDYEAVMELKSRFFRELYDQDRERFLSDGGFLRFFKKNKSWLVPYAVFSCLRDRFGTPEFAAWPEYSRYGKTEIAGLADPLSKQFDDVAVHYFIQYHLHLQLDEAAKYARKKRVVLKGDLPIGIFRNSVDAWVRPDLYHLDRQAGAPPDAFAATGQNWRFPTYNWERMAEDNYAWWRERLTHMRRYFDAYRIDHILGFFRIWEIPADGVEGLMGRFNPAMPMSRIEMEMRGLWFDHDRMCLPYIREYMIYETFGEMGAEAIGKYFDPRHGDLYALKPEFDTQKKIAENFAGRDDPHGNDTGIKNGLLSLVCNLLFFEEPGNPGHYHPRISLHSTYSYRELDGYSKRVVDEIYIYYFYKRHEQFWRDQAMIKLPAIVESTDMLVCGEDLGMVPDCVPSVMRDLKILSLEIQRMPKKSGRDFGDPAEAPYLSVASTSSHDMSTIRGWWEEDRERTQRFFTSVLEQMGEAPYFCEPWIVREIVRRHLFSPAMWAVFPLQDLLGMDGRIRREDPRSERINVPGDPFHYWRYRMHLNLEDLLKQEDFNILLSGLLAETGRNGVH